MTEQSQETLTPERRSRILTDADIKALADEIRRVDGTVVHCNLDLTMEEAFLLKRILKRIDSASAIIGRTILIAFVIFLIGIFTKGWWSTLAQNITNVKTP